MDTGNEIVVVDVDEWVGLYVNGTLELEGHGRSRIADVLAFSQLHAPASVRLLFVDDDYVEYHGLPHALLDIESHCHEENVVPDLAVQ